MAHGHITGDHRPCTKGAHGLWQGKGPHYDASFVRERADGSCAGTGAAGAAPGGGKKSHFLARGNSTRSCSLAIGMCQLRTSSPQLLTFPWLFPAHL